MNTGVIKIGNISMVIPALNYYTNYTLDTPSDLSAIGYPIMPLTAPRAQIGDIINA